MLLDDTDLKILKVLQTNAKISRSSLAEMIGLSVPAVSDRLHRLEEKEIIQGYYTRVNRKPFGYDILVFITVASESSRHYADLVKKADLHPNILECHSILGDGSHMLKAIVKNSEALEKLLSEIQAWRGVLSTKTSFVLSTSKETTEIEL